MKFLTSSTCEMSVTNKQLFLPWAGLISIILYEEFLMFKLHLYVVFIISMVFEEVGDTVVGKRSVTGQKSRLTGTF